MFRGYADNTPKESLDYIIRMAYLAEIKEWDNRRHIERIRRYCEVIGAGMNLSQQENEVIAVASMLHDVGKSNMPEELLRKTGQYESAEWEIIEKHTSDGARILSGASSLVLQVAEIIAHTHHERWDGSGYPRGLKGAEIPLSGRICALADVFDALTSARSYKPAIPETEALRIIRDSDRMLFDPDVVKVFSERFNEILKYKNALK